MLPKETYNNWRLYVILKDNLILPCDIKWEGIKGWKEGIPEEIINSEKKELISGKNSKEN